MEELQSFYMKADSDYDGIITWVGVYVCMGVCIYLYIKLAVSGVFFNPISHFYYIFFF